MKWNQSSDIESKMKRNVCVRVLVSAVCQVTKMDWPHFLYFPYCNEEKKDI